MQWVPKILRSFSFRLLFATLLLFFVGALLMRYALYHSTINKALSDTRHIISEQEFQIDQGIRTRGYQHGLNLIATILHFDVESNFALAYRDSRGRLREGNLTAWPEFENEEEGWAHFSVTTLPESSAMSEENSRVLEQVLPLFRAQEDGEIKHFLARVITYPNGAKLLVGYDLKQVNSLRSSFLSTTLQSSAIALIASIVSSLALAYWINRRLRVINRTCARVMTGDLEVRAPSSGSADEFDQLATNFNAMLGWISQLIHSTKDATNALAHDMRTPLSRHRIHLSQLLSREDLSDPQRDSLQAAVAEVDRIVELYDAILNISRAESRAAVESFGTFNLYAVLADIVELYGVFAEQKNVTLALDCLEGLHLKGEHQLVAQAVANLVDNALKYAPENSVVAIRATQTDTALIVSVSDQGIGIPVEEREKVKERFYRLDKSRSTSGTGLGLSLVDAVMRLHRGHFLLEDAQPGLRAVLEFPALA